MTDDEVADELLAVVHDAGRPLGERVEAAGLWCEMIPVPPDEGVCGCLLALLLTGAPPPDWPRPRCST